MYSSSRPSTASTRPASRGGVLPGAHKPRAKESEPVDKILNDTARSRSGCWSERRVHGQVVDPVLESELMSLLRRHDSRWTQLATPESVRRSPEKQRLDFHDFSGEPSLGDLSGASTDLEASRLAETSEGRRALIGRASNPASRLGTPSANHGSALASTPEDPKLVYRRELDEQIRVKRELLQQQAAPGGRGTPLHSAGGRGGVQPPFALVDEPPRNGSRAASRGVPLPPFALNDEAPGPRAGASQAEVSEVARRIKTMHWGEGDVQSWHEREARLQQYRADLARQVEEKRGRTARPDTQEHLYRHEEGRPAAPADVWAADGSAEPLPERWAPLEDDTCADATHVLDLCRAHGALAPEGDGDATPHYGGSPRSTQLDASALYGSDAHGFGSPLRYDDGGENAARREPSVLAGSACSEEYSAVMARMSELAGEVERQRTLIENLQQRPPLSARAQARSRPLHEPRKVTAKAVDRRAAAGREAPSRSASSRRSTAARRL